jgi:hypothetical protein
MRAPAVILAEIAWRWTFGVALWAILYYSFREYFASVEISRAEYGLLRNLEPYTWIAVAARMMIAFEMGLRVMGPIIIPALIILWVALASIGRAGTVRALAAGEPSTNWPSSFALSTFRVMLAFAALLAFFGGGILVNVILGDVSQVFGEAVLLMLLIMTVIAIAWGTANWFFSIAPIFAASERRGFWSSLTATGNLYQSHRSAFFSTGLWFAFARSILVVAVTIGSLLAFSTLSPKRGAAFIIGLTLVYFAIVDALNLWRLATYISFTEPEPAPVLPALPPSLPAEPVEERSISVGDPKNDGSELPPPPVQNDEPDNQELTSNWKPETRNW